MRRIPALVPAAVDPREAALIAFAVRVLAEPSGISDDDVAGLRAHGWSDRVIADVVGVVALNLLTGRIRQVELARRLRLEKSTVSRLVTNLAGRGWVHRETADGDGRGVLLVLTDAGATAAARQADARRDRLTALLDRVPDDQRAAVVRALQMLAEASVEPS
ncbi:MarR family transcriptional regulator [Lentzea albidocapillata]|uniref:MarR family transcriptional regulator n=1 Tax=Lentzea albidocapillata TaxID=40571 RepID=UPI0009FBD876|nr:MarR family transcriptional regulator [Lentzea albidocapillata]